MSFALLIAQKSDFVQCSVCTLATKFANQECEAYHIYMDLKDFLKLAGQQGKVVVMGDDGNVKGVFLSFDEFQKLSGQLSDQVYEKPAPQEDISEKVNREILQAQLEDVISTTDGGNGNPSAMQFDEETEEDETEVDGEDKEDDEGEFIDLNPPERIDSVLSKRAQELFKSIPYDPENNSDLIQSPYKDFKTPEVATSSDEEIKPNFDDI